MVLTPTSEMRSNGIFALEAALTSSDLKVLQHLCRPHDAPTFVWIVVHSGEIRGTAYGQNFVLGARHVAMLQAAELRVQTRRPVEATAFVTRGDASFNYTRFLVSKYGWWHYIRNAAPLLAHARHLGDLLPSTAASPLLNAAAAFDWMTLVHETLEAERVPLNQLFRLDAKDERALAPFTRYTLAEIASALGFSPGRLSGKLQARWGEKPQHVFARARMALAAKLLEEGEAPLPEIASQCGYRSHRAFDKAFLRHHGQRADDYREARRLCASSTQVFANETADAQLKSPLARMDPFSDSIAVSNRPKMDEWDGPYFRIICCGLVERLPQSPRVLAHSTINSRHLCLLLSLEGQAIFHLQGKHITLRPGMLLAYPNPISATITESTEGWRHFFINLEGPFAQGFFNYVLARGGALIELSDFSPLLPLAQEVSERVNRGEQRTALEWSRLAFRILIAWALATEAKGTRLHPVPLELWRLAPDPAQAPLRSVTEYAAKLGYSRQHTTRMLKAQWGTGCPARTILFARLDRAAAQLRNTNQPVQRIAAQHGFGSPSGFIRAFKRVFQLTPLAYRHQTR